MLIIKYSYGGLGVRASHPNVSYGFRTPGCETGKFAKSLMFDETGNLQHHSNRCTAKGFVSRINDIERASYNGSIEASQASDVGSIPTARSINPQVRPGDIGDRSYRRHRLHFWAKRIVERLQSFFLQIDVAEIVLHKADQPNTFFDLFDPQGLSCEDRAEINFFAVQTDASAVGDVNDAVVKRISKFWQSAIAADGGSVDFRGALMSK